MCAIYSNYFLQAFSIIIAAYTTELNFTSADPIIPSRAICYLNGWADQSGHRVCSNGIATAISSIILVSMTLLIFDAFIPCVNRTVSFDTCLIVSFSRSWYYTYFFVLYKWTSLVLVSVDWQFSNMWRGLTKPVLSLLSAVLIIHHNHKVIWINYSIKFYIQYKLPFSGLLFLAAFLKHSDDPYKWSGM